MPQPARKSKAAVSRKTQLRLVNTIESISVDGGWLKELARFALDAEKIDRAELSVALVDDAKMLELNRRYLNHDYPTDVLTFPFATGKMIQGEIVIGLEFARKVAADLHVTTMEEVGLYLIHGILHLCDYRDDDPVESEIMRERQEELLARFIRQHGLPAVKSAPEERGQT